MLRETYSRISDPQQKKFILSLYYSIQCIKERLIFGGRIRESILVYLLEQYYKSKFRRQWNFNLEAPHFFDHRINLFTFGFGQVESVPYSFSRAFFDAEILREGDELLDIGCGDGFFTRRFFASRCNHIDGIDIEPDAIQSAITYNNGTNIAYHLLDAVNEPFPRSNYDVVVWDGAIGHFPKSTTQKMLTKISQVLASEGIFVGSESLGLEGHDHLQFFDSLSDLASLFGEYFEFVELKEVSYPINHQGYLRREAYWRCSNQPQRIHDSKWQDFSKSKD